MDHMVMVVSTPGKPGIHLEFKISTWKTWNLHEKIEKHLEIEIFQMNFKFAKILTKLSDFRKF